MNPVSDNPSIRSQEESAALSCESGPPVWAYTTPSGSFVCATLLPLAEATKATELVQPDQRVPRRLQSVGRGNVQMPRDLFPKRRAGFHFEAHLDERCRHAEEAEHETWGSKVDEVTAEQVKNVSLALSVPGESASEPNREFQQINVD